MRAKTLLSALSFLAVLVPAQAFAADASNPDKPIVLKPKFGGRFGFELDAGPSLSLMGTGDAGAPTIFVEHIQTNVFLGHRLTSDSTMWLGLGYRGSAEFNDSEILQRHGLGVMVATKWVHAVGMVGGMVGVPFAGSALGAFSMGLAFGVRLGPVTLNAPMYLDFIPAGGTVFNVFTLAGTAGVAF